MDYVRVMRRSLTIVAGFLLAGALPVLSACVGAAPLPSPQAAGTTAAVSLEHNAADVAFVRALIPHHREGIALASAVVRPPEATTLAKAIIVTQQDEVVRLTAWLKAWSATKQSGPPTLSGPPTPSESSGDGALRALIAHQEEAITLAQNEQAKGVNLTALAFAKQIIESRTAEADQLRTYVG